jgi:hypothetical protein
LTGNEAFGCEKPRKIDRSHIPEIPAELAWKKMKAAAAEREIDDLKEAAEKYFKAAPDCTYQGLEKAFRSHNVEVFLIAIEKELAPTYTNIDLQGNLDRKYAITWRWSNKPARPKEKDGWPATAEDNMERLGDAGIPVDRGYPKCSNCDELGHTSKKCPEEKQENADRAAVKCFNCDEVGHRVRDCESTTWYFHSAAAYLERSEPAS